MNIRWLPLLLLGLILSCLSDNYVAFANNPTAVRLTDSGNRTVYQARYFDFENIGSLEQLLDQIPDFQHTLDDSLLGSGYSVLVNGVVAGKAPRDLKDIGRQFSFSDIKRIVVMRGPAALEYAGISGPVINITLKVEADNSTGRWEVYTPLLETGNAVPNVRLNYSNQPGDWGYEIYSAYLPNDRYSLRTRKDVYLDPQDFEPTQQRLTSYDERYEQYVLGGSLNWQVSKRLNLQADSRISERRKTRMQERSVDNLQGAAQTSLTHLEDDHSMSEVGLAAVVRLTTATIWESRFTGIVEQRDKVVATSTSGEKDLLTAAATRREDQRTEYSSAISTIAENGSESGLAVYFRQRKRNTMSALSLDPILLGTAGKITENRYGLAAHYGWRPLQDARVLTSLDIENWHLKQQNGQFSRNDRRFFVKPALDLRWKFPGRSMLRTSVTRQVRSLNLDQMVFNFDLDDEFVDVGNLSIVHEKSWLSTLFVEKRLLDQKGKLRLGGYYRQIEDRIERAAAPGGGSGPGNIGDAYARGVQLMGRYQMLHNSTVITVLKADFTLQESSVTDPFTGVQRALRGFPDKIAKLELRQEFPHTALDYVLDMSWRSDTYYSDHNYQETHSLDRPIVNLKANYQASNDIHVWFEVRGLFDMDEFKSRQKFAGDPALGQVHQYEQSSFTQGRQFSVGLQGYF